MTAPAGSVVLRRARIYPLAPGGEPDRAAEAMSVHHGRIVAVGSEADALAAVPDGTPNIDMGGRVVVPGFTDAHVHWAGFALARRNLELRPAMSLAEVLDAVAEAGAEKPAGAWIVGRGWDHSQWGRWPTAADLDRVSQHHPVALTRKDGH
ncbi:MAG: amidohydrolase family protein, partial [Anaerolineae bacterium]